jgi:hypothetical protein
MANGDMQENTRNRLPSLDHTIHTHYSAQQALALAAARPAQTQTSCHDHHHIELVTNAAIAQLRA